MRTLVAGYTKNIRRFGAVLASAVAGVCFVLVSNATAATNEKKVEINEIKKPEIVVKIEKVEKVEKVEKADSSAFFNRAPFFKPGFVRPVKPVFFRPNVFRPFFFNPFFDEEFD